VKSIDPQTLNLAQRIDKPLFLASGVKLLGAGTRITKNTLRVLRRLSPGDLFEGEPSVRERAAINAETTALRAASNAKGHWSPGVGTEDERSEFDLGPAPFAKLPASERDAIRARARRLKDAYSKVAEHFPLWERIPKRISPVDQPTIHVRRRVWPVRSDLAMKRDAAVCQLANVTSNVLEGEYVSVEELDAIVERIVALHRDDPPRFASYALMKQDAGDYLHEHSYTTACIAVAASETLCWDEYSVIKVGVASLLADLGMLHMPGRIRDSARPLDEFGVNNIWRHPAYSVVLLDSIAREREMSIIMVTHEPSAAAHCERVFILSDGRITGHIDTEGLDASDLATHYQRLSRAS